jgi:hypothetical protein
MALGRKVDPAAAVNVPFFGETKPVGQEGSFGRKLTDAVGTGTDVAATVVPAGKGVTAAKTLVGRVFKGAAEGAVRGGAFGAGTEAQNPDATPASIASEGVKGAVGGATVGGVLPAAGAATSKVAGTTGKLLSQVLGATTGAGAASVKAAAEGSPAFLAAMRGKINPDEVVQTAQDALQSIKDSRRTSYLTDLAKIGGNKKSLDISPLHEEIQKQLSNFGVTVAKDGSLDFSRSSIANNGSARADIQGVYDTLKNWGLKAGDRTPVGLDTLKKQLGDFYSPSGSARAFVQAVNGKLGTILKKQVPGYSEMTANYQKAGQLLDDIRSATGLGGSAKVDTVFTKLTTALKGDKELRLEILNTMSDLGKQPDLLDKIAGINMSPLVPKGMVGRGIDVGAAYAVLAHAFNPQFLPMLLSTSPRVVGEFINALGLGARNTKIIRDALTTVSKRSLPLVPAAMPRSNQEQAQTR